MQPAVKSKKVAVMIPAYNEGATIAKVIDDFKRNIKADIIVFNNNSTDNTKSIAEKSGAKVIDVFRQGKGFAVREMLKNGYDIYIMVDGDDTYPAEKVRDLLSSVVSGQADMVIGKRIGNIKALHVFGNKAILYFLRFCFPNKLTDILSGYRVFTREVARELRICARGFEIETEMTIKALDAGFKIIEVPVEYRKRPEKSKSKLKSFPDGLFILQTIFRMFRDYRPMQFFSLLAMISLSIAAGFSYNIVQEYLATHAVTRIPALTLCVFFALAAVQLLIAGIIASGIAGIRREVLES